MAQVTDWYDLAKMDRHTGLKYPQTNHNKQKSGVLTKRGGKSNKDRVESETHVISKQKQKAHDTTT